jgi:NAD(P)-dependent dehydrogenase (short-subunit alcohol dehydrogenase family)
MATVVVTGGSRGIGAATARRLANDGWIVAVGYRADADAAGAVVDAIVAAGGSATAIRADVSSEREVGALFEAAEGRLGRLGGLVNAAGYAEPQARVDAMSGGRLQRLFATNVVGSFLCAGEAVRRMSTRNGGSGGSIVNLSSAASRLGSPGEYVDYAASKGAIDTFTIGLAREVAGEGIRINAVRPGLIRTGFHAAGGDPDRIERLQGTIPMQRAGMADEVAAAIAWLMSDGASYATGALLDVSGGR